ncbi:MAG: [acyl-carrier-protein] S-malonyltransferase [Chloroflexi bacterium RBG_16_48_8]|nr:MAG: [acyl-carrier-protein] S-malonyltransferase [Chloroflexi bacterium RBG_16_48_8]
MAADEIAFLFPGQGSQTLGMGYLLAESYPQAADTFQEADRVLGFPLSDICWKGPREDLDDTFNTQPALLVHSIAVLRVVQSQFPGLRMSFTAGHSVGEFAALVAAGALNFQDGLLCVRERGHVMKEAGEETPGGMTAILGMELDTVEEICKRISSETGHSIWVANDNCPGQVVLSGMVAGLSVAEERLSSAGARKVVRLAISIPSHCPLMSDAQKKFNKILDETPILDPVTPIVGNVSGTFLHTAEEIRIDLRSQLISRVRWNESMHRLVSSGVTRSFELGPGNVLSGLMRRIDRSIPTISLDSPTSLSSLSNFTSNNR